jgi:hypothetical protein
LAARDLAPLPQPTREDRSLLLVQEIEGALSGGDPLELEQAYTNLLPALVSCDAQRVWLKEPPPRSAQDGKYELGIVLVTCFEANYS